MKYLHVGSDWGVRITDLLYDDGDVERTRARVEFYNKENSIRY